MTTPTKRMSVLILFLSLALGSCKGADGTSASDADESSANISESAMAEAGQQATATEGASSPNLMSFDELESDLQTVDLVDPQSDIHPTAACTFSSARSTCSSNVDTIAWNNCTLGTALLSGGWSETWSAGFCANGNRPGALTNGNSVTRTSSGQILTLASGATVTSSTTAHTAYDGTAIPGTGITVSMASGTRTIVINGLQKVMVGPYGRTWFNHSITSAGLSVSGTRAGGNRIVNGTSTLFHNLAKYKATHTFNAVTWGSSVCCYPTSGSISSTLTGSKTGNVSLTFTASCGDATFTDTDLKTASVRLSQCN